MIVTQESILAEALERLRQGIVVIEHDDRIVFVNSCFASIFGLDRNVCRVGAPFSSIVRHLAERGEYGAIDSAAATASRLQAMRRGEPWEEVRQRGNGQILLITGAPLASGYVYTYTDITREHLAQEQLRRGYKAAVVALADLAEHRDGGTGDHVLRVAILTHEITLALRRLDRDPGLLTDEICGHIATASILHDVGKVVVPDGILLKPGGLDAGERKAMQDHAAAGAAILQKASRLAPESPYFSLGNQIARSHHERYDGRGYPDGLSGDHIPLAARIAAVADVYDALVSERPYKEAWSVEQAIAAIRDGAGTQFDPQVVEAFLLVMEERASSSLIQWSAEMSVGDEALDRDHRYLIGLLNQLASPSCRHDRTTQELVLDELLGYTIGHFSREELYLERAGFPQLERHRRIHQGLTDHLIAIRDRFAAERDIDVGDEVAMFLTDWLRSHIMREDMQYSRFIAARAAECSLSRPP